MLVEGWDAEKAHDLHLKNYVYFAMAFSFAVEMLNMYIRKREAGQLNCYTSLIITRFTRRR